MQIYVTYVLRAAYIFLCLRTFFCALEPNVMTLYRSDFFYYSKIWNGKQYPLENVIFFKMEMEFFAIWHLNTLQQYLSINSFDERYKWQKKITFKCFFAISNFAIIEKITSAAAAAATTNLIEEKHIWQKSLRHSYPSGFSNWPNENSCNAYTLTYAVKIQVYISFR